MYDPLTRSKKTAEIQKLPYIPATVYSSEDASDDVELGPRSLNHRQHGVYYIILIQLWNLCPNNAQSVDIELHELHNNTAVVFALQSTRKVAWLHNVARASVMSVQADDQHACVPRVEFCHELVSVHNSSQRPGVVEK